MRWRRLNADAMAAAEAWIGERRRVWTARLDALERQLRTDPAADGRER
ncbi:MAG TPA: hypothetical protein VGF50_09895 [Caulobacteraceae bacterium]